MKIKAIKAHRVGPFYEEFLAEIDERVTILTGANDVGKSSLLQAIALAFSSDFAGEEFINHDHVLESPKPWMKDTSIIVEAMIRLERPADIPNAAQSGISIKDGDTARIRRTVAKDAVKTTIYTKLRAHGASEHEQFQVVTPTLIKPGSGAESKIRDIIDLNKPNKLEQALLDTGFKAPFNFSKLAQMNSLQFSRAIRDAQGVLNRHIGKVLPNPGMVKFDLMPVEGDRSKLGVLVRDRHDGITPFGTRGSGVQRMITLMAELITQDRNAYHKVVLLDEPENSLHPDAQHLLREFLYDITADGKTQVIYATHSAAMVNPMRGEQVRVLVRTKSGETATTKLLHRPTDGNFLGLRTSLGMSPADSLLFAPVTVITEGATEVGCLPRLIDKLEAAGHLNAFEVRKLLGLANFMDGMGDSFEFLCRFAKTHGARVVLFLDGDKRHKVNQLKMNELHSDVPIIFLPGASEFEELVPARVYLNALGELTGIAIPDDAENLIAQWVGQIPNRARLAFSKRVEGWFQDNYAEIFPAKKGIMQKAIELADPADIVKKPIEELFLRVQEHLTATSFS